MSSFIFDSRFSFVMVYMGMSHHFLFMSSRKDPIIPFVPASFPGASGFLHPRASPESGYMMTQRFRGNVGGGEMRTPP